jgi:hypothetical protein
VLDRIDQRLHRTVQRGVTDALRPLLLRHPAPHPWTGDLAQPDEVVGHHEMPRRPQDMSAQDRAGVEQRADVARRGAAGGSACECPERVADVLALHGKEAAHDGVGGGVPFAVQTLRAQPPPSDRSVVHLARP